jgi:hypothetical protein
MKAFIRKFFIYYRKYSLQGACPILGGTTIQAHAAYSSFFIFLYKEHCATVTPPLLFSYRYIGKIDDNDYRNGIGYADVLVTITLVQR